ARQSPCSRTTGSSSPCPQLPRGLAAEGRAPAGPSTRWWPRPTWGARPEVLATMLTTLTKPPPGMGTMATATPGRGNTVAHDDHMMIDALRGQLRDLIGAASALDGELAEAEAPPALAGARALVELAKLNDRLGKVAGKLTEAAARFEKLD